MSKIKSNKSNKQKDMSGFIIIGGLLIGYGIGIILDHAMAGLLIGLGAGFVARVILSKVC